MIVWTLNQKNLPIEASERNVKAKGVYDKQLQEKHVGKKCDEKISKKAS